jgi:hypothetical protein
MSERDEYRLFLVLVRYQPMSSKGDDFMLDRNRVTDASRDHSRKVEVAIRRLYPGINTNFT